MARKPVMKFWLNWGQALRIWRSSGFETLPGWWGVSEPEGRMVAAAVFRGLKAPAPSVYFSGRLFPQGLKPRFILVRFAARVNSCPDTSCATG